MPKDANYTKRSWPTVEQDHASVITYLDSYIGEFMSMLLDLGIDENTIVFFASDNGAHLEGGHSYKFFNSTGGLLGHKRSLYEGGVRSPTMVRWPNKIKGGRVSDFQWAFYDVMATFADLAGAAHPARTDGISIVPTLMGHTQKARPYIYNTWRGTGMEDDSLALPKGWTRVQNSKGLLEYVHTDGRVSDSHPLSSSQATNAAPGYGIRVGDYKGVVAHCSDAKGLRPSDGDKFEVYNLAKDPFETNDISATDIGKLQIQNFLRILKADGNISCACFQC